LAIELAAARARFMTMGALRGQLSRRLDALAEGPADLPSRQRSLRGALQWSYELLDTHQQRLFADLAVFEGGATLETIAEVCGGSQRSKGELQRDAEVLADKSLLQVIDVAGQTRFAMLETIREYALEHLGAASDGAEAVHRRHAEYFASYAELAERQLRSDGQIRWLAWLDAERANMHAAIGWALEHAGAEIAGRICAALWPFWRARGSFYEARRWLKATLDLGTAVPAATRAAAFNGAGVLALFQNEYELAAGLLAESRDLYTTIGDMRGVAHALSNLGWLAHDRSHPHQAEWLFEDSLARRRAIGDTWGEGWSLNNLGMTALERGEPEAARARFEESAAIFRHLGDSMGSSQTICNLGWAIQELGEYEQATALFSESLALSRQLDDARGAAHNLSNLALMAMYRGSYQQAHDLFAESLGVFRDIGDRRGMAEALEGLAGAAGLEGAPEQAARLFGVAAALREAIGAPLLGADRSRYETTLTAARELLDEAAWERAWAEGRDTSTDEAITNALENIERSLHTKPRISARPEVTRRRGRASGAVSTTGVE
jgi:predicted ATPase